MRLNPIVKKDVRVQSRSMRICWGVFAYELILALVFFLAMMIIQEENRYSTSNIYSSMVMLYPILAVTQLMILGVVVPVRTASSISGERERQTFDIMMTTGMTPFSIVCGKIMTAIAQSMLFVVASMPTMALSFIIGGMSWAYLFWFLAIALLVSFFSASIGILCSSLCKKSISAVIMSYGFYIIFFFGTFLPYILYAIIYSSMTYSGMATSQTFDNFGEDMCLFLLVNPIVYLVEFFVQVMTGESVMNSVSYLSASGTSQTGSLLSHVATGSRWMIVSTILFIGVSFFFLWLAAKRINPIKGRVKTVQPPQQMQWQQQMPQQQMPPQQQMQWQQQMPPSQQMQWQQQMPPQQQGQNSQEQK